MKRKVSFPGKTKLGVTFGKGKNANVVKTVADGGLFAERGVEAGWTVVKVNRTTVDYKSALDVLKKSMKRDGDLKLEFEVPVKPGAGDLTVMFDGKKKCGFTLEPKSTVIKSVEKRSAAGKSGVEKGFSVVAVNGIMVNGENIRSELKVSKGQRKYPIIFGSPQKKNRNKMLMSIQVSAGEHKDNDHDIKAQEEGEQIATLEAEKKKAMSEAEQNASEVAEQKAKEDAEQKAREEAEQKEKEESEQKAREEAAQRAREEAEQRAREEAEKRAKEEEEKRAKEEEEKLAKEEAEKKAREEAEQKEREEAEQRAREAAEQKAKAEAEQRVKEEAEQRAKEEEERRVKEEAEQMAKEEAEKKEREEAERKAREAEQKAQEEAEQKAREETEQKKKVEAERKVQEEAEQKAQDDAEMKAKEEAEQEKFVNTEPLVKKNEELKPSDESTPLASEKVEEKTEDAQTALPDAELKSASQVLAEAEPKPETINNQPTASDGVGTAAASEVSTAEQKTEDAPKDDDIEETKQGETVVKEETTVTECDVVEDFKQTNSANDAEESEVATDAQPEAQTENKESPSDKSAGTDDSEDNKMEPVAEIEIAKSSIRTGETEMKSQEPDQIKADKLKLEQNDKIDSKPTEEKDLPAVTAAQLVSEA